MKRGVAIFATAYSLPIDIGCPALNLSTQKHMTAPRRAKATKSEMINMRTGKNSTR